ncbi:hypothetical protein HYPDE_37228 [Hyphomicrobium denitrificans 1NES1]|uniref:DUF2948 family protein n=2 Tax=Hyphomicrobium denitrificans TaxID=53399 RepID=N0BA37_9HYPH|nr:hypothetical protein HYPDE_37228 [Hyphomicrobium denitrificans 1NES1]
MVFQAFAGRLSASMPDLKLIALDAEDLNVISAHLQDALLRVGEMTYLPSEKRFVVIANRFDWGKLAEAKSKPHAPSEKFERRRTGIRFERVLGAKLQGIDLKDKRAALALLAITFEPTGGSETPEGNVTLTFSGAAAIRLHVECVEVELKDLGAAWATKHSPEHPEDAG